MPLMDIDARRMRAEHFPWRAERNHRRIGGWRIEVMWFDGQGNCHREIVHVAVPGKLAAAMVAEHNAEIFAKIAALGGSVLNAANDN